MRKGRMRTRKSLKENRRGRGKKYDTDHTQGHRHGHEALWLYQTLHLVQLQHHKWMRECERENTRASCQAHHKQYIRRKRSRDMMVWSTQDLAATSDCRPALPSLVRSSYFSFWQSADFARAVHLVLYNCTKHMHYKIALLNGALACFWKCLRIRVQSNFHEYSILPSGP